MFYSHQLLARKAPLGQIWMAATMHAKINRRKLDKLNIIKICEEILNPSVPMALRLSGILMGGVVIVYERKVKLLYDDVNRLLVEINEAWRVKPAHDPTLLPKSRNQARYEAVTLPEASEMEIEQSMLFSSASGNNVKSHRKGFRMQLDDLEDEYIQIDPKGVTPSQQHHQADPANITLLDDLDSCVAETDLYNRFERFDIDGDEDDAGFNFTQKEPQVPSTLAPSPPHEPPQQAADEFIKDHHMEEQDEQKTEQFGNEAEVAEQDAQGPRFTTRSAKRELNNLILDDEQLIISGSIYQTWLQNTFDIVKRRGKKTKPLNPITSGKVAILMELPPTTLVPCIKNFSNEVHYPALLMELWRKCTREQSDTNCLGGRSANQAQEPLHPPEPSFYPRDAPEFHVEDFNSEVLSQALHGSIEKLRANMEKDVQERVDYLISERSGSVRSPGQSAAASNPSSGSGRSFVPLEPEVRLPSGGNRSKRRQYSSSANSFGNLDPVEEEAPLLRNSRELKLRRLSEKGPTPDFELLEETGPTQTPHHMVTDTPMDKITETIRTHLKVHFKTPGAPQSESLDQLAYGMNRKTAAQLFYQACVLANFDYIKIHQAVSYGEILIAKGPKM